MNTTLADDYSKLADIHLQKLSELSEQKRDIDKEIEKTRQLFKAIVNMLPDKEKAEYRSRLGDAYMKNMGLTQAIRETLIDCGTYVNATTMRDALITREFDFSSYTSNPLSSIHSILKRFKPSEVETTALPDGTTGYRWKKRRK